MLKLSRISRSIMVIIYTIFICFVTYLAVSENSTAKINLVNIAIYLIAVLFSICLYQVIKRRLRGKTDNQTVRRAYRFGYIAVVLVVSRLLIIFFSKNDIAYADSFSGLAGSILKLLVAVTGESKYAAIILNTIIVYINSVVIKRIMLNIFENDAVATMSSLIYILSPISLTKCCVVDTSNFNTLFILLGIYLIYLIYDEIIEYGAKNKKYLCLSALLAVIIALDLMFGDYAFIWCVIGLNLAILPDYVDKDKFRIKSKTIFVNKGLISLAIIVVISLIFWRISKQCGLSIYSFGKAIDIFDNTNKIYILLGVVVVLFETLAVALNRKNSFKVTFMKIATVVFGLSAIFYMRSLIAFDALFSMAFVLSIGNMYYNREEKIKLLKEGN